jgi:hypothetical protein
MPHPGSLSTKATKKYIRLSEQEVETLEQCQKHWRKVGFSVGESEEEPILAGLHAAYQAAGLKSPRIIIWLKSPHAGAMASRLLSSDLDWPANLLPEERKIWDDVWKQTLNQIKRLLGSESWNQVRIQLREQAEQKIIKRHGFYIEKIVKEEFAEALGIWIWQYLRRIMGRSAFQQIRNDVESIVQQKVKEQASDELLEEIFQKIVPPLKQELVGNVGTPIELVMPAKLAWQSENQSLGKHCFGHLDASWIAYYDFLEKIGVGGIEPLSGLKKLTESCGWWWPFENLCIVTSRPLELDRDTRGRLHSETGMALRYPDGWGLHSWHGVIVPEYVISMPTPMTFERVFQEPNAEVRRVLIERLNLEDFIKNGDCTPIHQDQFGILYRLNDEEFIRIVRVINPTPEPDGTYKEYFLAVPPNIVRAKQAVAWTFGLTEEEYEPLVQT